MPGDIDFRPIQILKKNEKLFAITAYEDFRKSCVTDLKIQMMKKVFE
jgi:hypothetical protein